MRQFKTMVTAVTVLTVTALFLQGCGSSGNESASSTSNSNSPKQDAKPAEVVTLTVWGDHGNQAVVEGPFQKMDEAFMKEHPNIKIDYQAGVQDDDKVSLAIQANELPDLFFVLGNKTPKLNEYVKNGLLLPLDNVDTSRYPKDAIDYSTVDGKIYSALPAFVDNIAVYYNKDIFAKNGVQVPQTYDDFLKLPATLSAKGVTPFVVPGKAEWDRAWLLWALAPVLANDAFEKADKGQGALTDPAIAKVFQTYRDFADMKYFNKDFISMDVDSAKLAFTNGKAAMYVDGTWDDKAFVQSGINLGRFYIPNAEGKRVVSGGYSNFTTYAVSAKTQHPKEATEYAKFLMSQEAQQIYENETGSIPALKDITPKNDNVKELAAFDSSGVNIYTVLSDLSDDQHKPTDVYLGDVVPKLMTGTITGEQAAQMLDKAAVKK